MKTYIITLVVVTFVARFVSSNVVGSQQIDPDEELINLSSVTILPSPENLKMKGFYYYDFSTTNVNEITVTLYDKSKRYLSTVKLSESIEDNKFLYTIDSDGSDRECIEIERQSADSYLILIISVSSGEQLHVKAQGHPGGNRECNMFDVQNVEVLDGGIWKSIKLDRAEIITNRWSNTMKRLEEDRVFTTPLLKSLGAVLDSFEALQAQTRRYTQFTGCSALCFRLSTLIPIYVCDDGSWDNCSCSSSQGFWLIPECGLYITCWVQCSEFPPVA